MAALALFVLVAALALAANLCRPSVVLGVLIGTVVLVPGSLPLPGGPGFLTVHRIVLIAAAAGLLRRCFLHELPWSIWSLPPMAYRFALVVGVFAFIGLGLLQPATDPDVAERNWQALAVQVAFLVVWLVLLRACDDPVAGASLLVAATLVGGLIAVAERATGTSYARIWFHAIPSLLGSEQAQVLARRGGHVRVRGAADFTLAYAWMTAAVVPLLMVVTGFYVGLRRVLLLVGLPLLGTAVVLTYSRTVVAPLGVALLVVGVLLRDRVTRFATAGVFSMGLFALAFIPSVSSQFSAAVDQGSIDVRVERLPVVGELVAHHAYTGLGLGGLASQGIPVTDTSYLQTYAEVGVIGLAAFVALLLSGVLTAFWAGRSTDRGEGRVAFAAGMGALLIVGGTLSFDAFAAPAVAEVFWLLIAFGLVAQDGVPTRRRPFPLRARFVVVLVAAGVGLLLRGLAPSHVAVTFQYETLQTYTSTVYEPTYLGQELRDTLCTVVKRALEPETLTCQSAGTAAGQGILRLQADDRAHLARDQAVALAAIHGVKQLARVQLQPRGPVERGTATGLRTAPVWVPELAALLLLPVPGSLRRRR